MISWSRLMDTEIWWPGVGVGSDMCSVDICVKICLTLEAREDTSFTYAVTLKSTSTHGGPLPELIQESTVVNMGLA
ncbi:MAG: hypothetical protein CM15mP3_03130 [Candidatus Poseidoniales archaeon]|nr:MAG: hypothetical protein CM15mP3_03130 [Candidatus Poseidoniales archaeon]